MSANFEIVETRQGAIVRLTLRGDLDHWTASTLEKRLLGLCAQGLPVRLNLSQLEFMDSSGVSALIRVAAHSRASGWRFEIDHDLSPFVESRLRHLGIDTLLRRQPQVRT